MPTKLELKTAIAEDLNDAGISYADADLNESIQDAYDDIAFLTGCIVKKSSNLNWTALTGYYDLSSLITDFMACKAIFNNQNSRFLEDSISLRQFEKFGDDWELHTGTPEHWINVGDGKRIAVYKKYAAPSSTFNVFYSAKAPILADGDTPLVAQDMFKLFNYYVQADMLESYNELEAAKILFELYYPLIFSYKDRVKNISKPDLLMYT